MPPSCAVLGGFAIGARVALLWQHNANAKCLRVHACTRSMPTFALFWLMKRTLSLAAALNRVTGTVQYWCSGNFVFKLRWWQIGNWCCWRRDQLRSG